MRGFGFSQACACVVLLASLVNLGAATDLFNGQQNYRVLHAATKRADLQRRSMRITKKFEAELSYIEDENGWSGKSTFASQVRVFSKKPITNLEEIEHHLKDVQCRDGKMKLHFVDKSSARDAFHSCHGANGGLIITSHQGCNAEGERTVYKVHDVSFADYDQNLELSTTKVLFQDAFDGIDVAFGHTTDDHLFRRHEIFAKVHGKPHVAYHRRDDKNKLVDSFKLDAQLINKSFSLEEFKVGLKPGARTLDIPAIGCKNCTTKGSMSLSHGAFSLDLSPFDEIKDEILSKVPEVVSKIPEIVSKVPEIVSKIPDIVTKIPIPKITELPKIPDFFKFSEEVNTNGIKDIKNVIKGGSFELSTSGISAHLDMFAKPKESGEFEILLFKVPVLGFSIPGIGQAGAVFEPRIVADFETSEALEISYGIDVTIPDKANLVINIANIPDSKANGFADSKLTPLPIRTNATNIDIDLGLAFKPTIPIGFEFTEKFKAEASVSMQLPRLDVKLSSDTEEYCDADFEGDEDEEEDEADEDEEEDETEENDEEDETDDTEEDTEDTEDAEDTEDTDEKDETDETDPTDEKDETDEAEDEETEPEETDETDPTDEDDESDQTDEKDESEETGDTDESDESDELDDFVEADPTDDTKEDEETEESDEIDEDDQTDEADETDETEEADEADDVDEDEDDMEDTADAKRRFRRATPKPLLVVSADLSIAIEVGIDIKFSLPKGPLPQIPPVQKTATLFSTAKPLVTSCATPEEAFKSLKNIIASALPNKAATPTLRARSDPMLEHACRVPLGNGTEEIRWPANSTHNASVSNQAHDGPVPMFSLLPLCNTTSSGVGPSNNGTVAPSGGPITITSTVRATGSLSPSTQAPSAPVTQTSSPAPSSAAVRGEALKGSGWWWQLCVVGVSLAMGVLVVL